MVPSSPTQFTGTTILPNGDLVLPNGTIVTPSGQVVGQVGSTAGVGTMAFVNPYDQYTGSARVQKLFNGGVVALGTSFQSVDYEHATLSTPNYTNKTLSEDASFWLGPTFFAYTDGVYNLRSTDPNVPATAYRITGGIGTRQIGLFRASAYFGYQGSGASTPDLAGGDVFGGTVSYYPTPLWTISANVDETINHVASNAPPSTLALSTPAITPLQIPVSGSTKITSTGLHSSYIINSQWTLNALFGYTHIENIGSPIWEMIPGWPTHL